MNAGAASGRVARVLLVACVLLTGSAGTLADDTIPANPQNPPLQPGRPQDSRAHEPDALRELQRRLDLLAAGQTPDCETTYAAHKAQAWLNFGKYAATEQLPRAVQAAALRNATTIAQILEQRTGSALETPELPDAHRVRDDLWQGIAAVKSDGRLCAAPKMTAYCEVQLAWADYEAAAGGWRHADPYVRIAEDYCNTAGNVTPPAALIAPEPAVTEPDRLMPIEPTHEIELVANVVFGHNRARRMEILPPGREDLRHLVQQSRSLGRATVFLLSAHADLTGHTDYNQRLSEQRARSVARELEMLGVPSARIKSVALGSSKPLIECPADEKVRARHQYLGCLEPNRRVVVRLLIRPPPQALGSYDSPDATPPGP